MHRRHQTETGAQHDQHARHPRHRQTDVVHPGERQHPAQPTCPAEQHGDQRGEQHQRRRLPDQPGQHRLPGRVGEQPGEPGRGRPHHGEHHRPEQHHRPERHEHRPPQIGVPAEGDLPGQLPDQPGVRAQLQHVGEDHEQRDELEEVPGAGVAEPAPDHHRQHQPENRPGATAEQAHQPGLRQPAAAAHAGTRRGRVAAGSRSSTAASSATVSNCMVSRP
ncbi:hypothetical protein CFN78_25790 [Amycolatopsis antarctica]|uniref:Uncharacterized protein n=1 Tax=Amycolatopsis antarctica TaxID=1854586 RepID=A0A263CY38_9PSEU|nr:hypothetical protein CFN78_25790 [Amycolatopsis antarctica]